MTVKHILMTHKTIATAALALLLSSTAQAVQREPYEGSRIFWDVSSRVPVFNSGGYSRMIRLQDGRILAACESGGIKISFSSDDGRNWSSPRQIVANTNNVPNCVPDLIQLADGTIVVGYNPRPSTPYTADRHFGIRCKRSTDGGESWSSEIFINDADITFSNGCWEPSFLELPSGELQCYFADEGPYTSSSEQQISLCRSFDKGATWSKAQKVSFRPGKRDGMPVPVLLADGKTIVLAIEDNGWPGINDFFPTTVRCALSKNWSDNYFVSASSPDRRKTLDPLYQPQPSGGAPYLRVVGDNATVLSWQSPYNHGNKNAMLVAVGDANAENFKAISSPFYTPDDVETLWNSLSVLGGDTIAAVGGVGGKIEMIKGYVRNNVQASFATPTVNGKIDKNDGYTTTLATQLLMGNTTGNRINADFAYDNDSLYMLSRVVDRTAVNEDGLNDCVRLMLDIEGASDTRPQKGMYRIELRRDGSVDFKTGNDGEWKAASADGINLKTVTRSSYYFVETAIPWKLLGRTSLPTGRRMAVNFEVDDAHDGTFSTERLPDMKPLSSWSWMEFKLRPSTPSGISSVGGDAAGISVSCSASGITVEAPSAIRSVSLYLPDGQLVGQTSAKGRKATVAAPVRGIVIVSVVMADGTRTVRKVSLS